MKQKNSMLGKVSSLILWRGLFLVIFGIIALLWSGLTLSALILTFGLFAVADGIVLIFIYATHSKALGRGSLWFGLISLLIGVFILYFPSLTAIFLGMLVAVRALIGGLLDIRMAMHLRKQMAREVLLVLNGLLSIVFALILILILFVFPVLGLLVLIEVIGIYAIFVGCMFVALSSRMKNMNRKQLANATEVF